MQVQTSLLNISRATLGLTDAQRVAATGKRISKASDDVPGTDRALTLRSALSTIDQLADNCVVSKPLLDTTDSALASMASAIKSVQTICMAAANSSVSDSVRQDYIRQLDSITEDLADTANTRYLDQYVFSGTLTGQPAVTAQAGPPPFTYTGNDDVRKVQVLNWVSVQTGIPGSKVFNFDGSAGAGTTDMFTMIANVRDAIASGNINQMSSQLTNIQANYDNVLSCRSRVGAWLQRLDKAQGILDDGKGRFSELLSNVEDADLPQAIIWLQTQQNVYQAALSVSSQAQNLSLASLRQ